MPRRHSTRASRATCLAPLTRGSPCLPLTCSRERQSDASAFHSNSSDRQDVTRPRKRGRSNAPHLRELAAVAELYGQHWAADLATALLSAKEPCE